MKVLLGMSGGVDSAVSAVLLQEQGYEVIGATMKVNSNQEKDIQDAKNVCNQLGIQHFVFDYIKEFKEYVISYFINSYLNCETPNPCIECNKFLKFNLLYKEAKKLGCDFLATGHYAKVEFVEKYNKKMILKSNAGYKDQTYFLYSINKDILDNLVFPLGMFENKEQIRKIAEEHKLKVFSKKDSQDICFIPNNDYVSFLNEFAGYKDVIGNIVDKDGNVLGQHNGLIKYTIGQRKGMGISNSEPLYVISLDKEKNQVVVGNIYDLLKKELQAKDLNFHIDNLEKNINIQAKIRYASKPENAILNVDNKIAYCTFSNLQKSITPGQSVVFYDGDILIGGGKII